MEVTGTFKTMSLTYSHRKKSSGIISGRRWGQGIGPSRPTQRPGKCTYEANVGMPHFAGTPYLADLPSMVIDSTAACHGRPSLSLFIPQRKRASEFRGHGNPDSNLESHCILRRSVEWENDRWITKWK
jgi:hypothetical protein